jgi:hypothetical protein
MIHPSAGTAATPPACTITGTHTFQPVSDSDPPVSDHCPLENGDYYIFTTP